MIFLISKVNDIFLYLVNMCITILINVKEIINASYLEQI